MFIETMELYRTLDLKSNSNDNYHHKR